MNTVVLEVRSLAQALADAAHAMKTLRGKREAPIAFATPELLWQVLTAKRWHRLKVMRGPGRCRYARWPARQTAMSRRVHGDITALLDAGVLRRTPQGEVEFPFDAVKVEFLLQAA